MRTSLCRVLSKTTSSYGSTRLGQIGATLSSLPHLIARYILSRLNVCAMVQPQNTTMRLGPSPLLPIGSCSTRIAGASGSSRGNRVKSWYESLSPNFPRRTLIELEPCPHSEDSLGHPRLLHSSLWQIRDRPIFGNYSFFIIPDRGRIRVYCFDKNFVLTNENLSYRKKREEKTRARKAKIRRECSSSQNLRGCPKMASCR